MCRGLDFFFSEIQSINVHGWIHGPTILLGLEFDIEKHTDSNLKFQRVLTSETLSAASRKIITL